MLRKVIIGVPTVLAVLGLVVALQSATFHIERSITIAAPAENAFAMVNDLNGWRVWSPYEKLDPNMKRMYSGARSGSGAVYAWSGNHEVGEGRMTIVKSDRPTQVSINLEFFKPFTATNTATFNFEPAVAGTKVTWAMDGGNNFMAKAAHLLMDMDKMVGGDFERGLATLKTVVEAASTVNAQAASTGK